MQQPPGAAQARCGQCGAPDDGELVICRFCKNAISQQLLASAIQCPQCRTACRWGKQRCAQCSAWIVVACVFCGAISPCNQPACMTCHEPFAGAMQKKQAQQQAAQHQQNMQTYGVVGNVAASFVGAAAGSVVGSAVSHSWFGPDVPHHHQSWGFNSSSSSWDNNNASYDNSSSYDNSNSGNAGESSAGDAGSGDGGLLGGLFGGDGGGDGGSSDGGSSDGGSWGGDGGSSDGS